MWNQDNRREKRTDKLSRWYEMGQDKFWQGYLSIFTAEKANFAIFALLCDTSRKSKPYQSRHFEK